MVIVLIRNYKVVYAPDECQLKMHIHTYLHTHDKIQYNLSKVDMVLYPYYISTPYA